MAYFANGSEGAIFDAQCSDCIHKDPDAGCPISLAQMNFNYDQMKKGNEQLRDCLTVLVNNEGVCQLRKFIVKEIGTRRSEKRLVFGDRESILANKI